MPKLMTPRSVGRSMVPSGVCSVPRTTARTAGPAMIFGFELSPTTATMRVSTSLPGPHRSSFRRDVQDSAPSCPEVVVTPIEPPDARSHRPTPKISSAGARPRTRVMRREVKNGAPLRSRKSRRAALGLLAKTRRRPTTFCPTRRSRRASVSGSGTGPKPKREAIRSNWTA